jgi:hypothetical protein
MHVCLLSHAGIGNIQDPDQDEGYSSWKLKMEKKTSQATKEWARTVLFLNYKTYIVEEKGKKRGTGGHRVIYTTHTPAWDAKNRAGLPEELRLEYASIASLFSVTAGNVASPKPTPTPIQQPTQPTASPEPKPQATSQPAFLLPLMELIQRDKVTEHEVQLAVAKRGYYPADTPLANYDPQFVAGKLVAYWSQVVKWIETIRQEVAA